jgi:hypothetical protein
MAKWNRPDGWQWLPCDSSGWSTPLWFTDGDSLGKLAQGKLIAIGGKVMPLGEVYYKDNTHPKPKAISLWDKKGQAWESLKGVEEVNPHDGVA